MKWQCALLQRWLPEYPDGDLSAFWKRRLSSHLEHCAECRRELAALREVVAAIKAAPVAEPGEEFWSEFSRDLHLKLARVAHEVREVPPVPSRTWSRSRLPYLLGGPALAVLALWLITTYTTPQHPGGPQTRVARTPVSEKAEKVPAARMAEASKADTAEPPRVATAPPAEPSETFTYATLNGSGPVPDEDDDLDLSTSDLDSVLAGMSDQEKERFLNRLDQHKKDGSCLKRFSSVFLA
jgi:hypothetical protein